MYACGHARVFHHSAERFPVGCRFDIIVYTRHPLIRPSDKDTCMQACTRTGIPVTILVMSSIIVGYTRAYACMHARVYITRPNEWVSGVKNDVKLATDRKPFG